jgi:hypothetical protein
MARDHKCQTHAHWSAAAAGRADDNEFASFVAGEAAGLVELFESEKAGDASTVIRLVVTKAVSKAASEPRIWRSAAQPPSIRSAHAVRLRWAAAVQTPTGGRVNCRWFRSPDLNLPGLGLCFFGRLRMVNWDHQIDSKPSRHRYCKTRA